ncbi:MAG: thioredoxin family protein [Saprospiraceae bacterium]
MKNLLLFSTVGIVLLSITFLGFKASPTIEIISSEIKWYTLEEALIAQEKNDKKIFIDMYTDWCGWCKVMDKKTFTNPEVIQYMNENFYAVKFNAEQKEAITYKGKKYEFIPTGKRGIHRLAYELMDKSATYPSFVLLDENLNSLGIITGYKTPAPFLSILKNKISL